MQTKLIWITQEELKRRLHYNPDTGIFTWKIRPNNNFKTHVAGSLSDKGYVIIRIDRRNYKAHRLAFLYMEGSFPRCQMDHRNQIKSDNRWENLRESTNSENRCNTDLGERRNIIWVPSRGKYLVSLRKDKKYYGGGMFKDIEAAKRAATELRKRFHGDFAYAN